MNFTAKFGYGYNFTAVFEVLFRLQLTYDSSLGTASYTRDVDNGNKIYLTCTPDQDAQFLGWYNNSLKIGSSTSLTYTLSRDTVIEARFEPIYSVTTSVDGDGAVSYSRATDKNEVTFTVIPDAQNHFVKYLVNDQEYFSTPLTIRLSEDVDVVAYFAEDERLHISASTNIPYASVYVSANDDYSGYTSILWARPFPDYQFVGWQDGDTSNPRTITVTENITLVAVYHRVLDTNGIYQYRCFVKDQMALTDAPKAFMVVDTFDVKRDLMTKATSSITVLEMASNINDGDVLVLYDPKGTFLYNGVITSIEDKTLRLSQMPSFYKGTWIYNVSPQDYLEHEIAVLLGDYADGKLYGSTWTDDQVATRLGGITIDYTGATSVSLPTDLDDDGNEQYTQKDMEDFIYELYDKYNIIFDFEINISGANYVHIKVPTYDPIKVGNNMYAIQNMSPVTTIEETNKLVIFAQDKTYRTTYIATKNDIVEEPSTTANRFDITNTVIVFSDDDVADLVASNLPQQFYNHHLSFDLIVKNFIYQFGDFNLGGTLDIYHNDDYYDSVLTGYEIKKNSNQNITDVQMVCGKVRVKLTNLLTMGKV